MTTTRVRDSCSALSYLIGDGVCDEITNHYRCLYDGGDCCKEDRDEKYCQNCTCRAHGRIDNNNTFAWLHERVPMISFQPVDDEKLNKEIDEKNVTTFVLDGSRAQIVFNMNGSSALILKVLDIESSKVCAQLCLDNENTNAWIYDKGNSSHDSRCHCAMIPEIFCKEDLGQELSLDFHEIDDDDDVDSMTIAFIVESDIQLVKHCESELHFSMSKNVI